MKSILIQEVWKPVFNFEYTISTFGRVKNSKGVIITPHLINGGYQQVRLTKDKKRYCFLVHRLVYETFVGVIPEGMQVNHINEIKTDNSVWNLNLMTNQENCNYGRRNQKISNKNKGKTNYKLIQINSHPIRQTTLDDKLLRIWSSAAEAGRHGFNHRHINECCHGKRHTHKGCKWSFI